MRYHALACDYDGTIAHHGVVNEKTIAALERLRQSGRRLLMVSGRELEDLLRVFPRVDLFERLVLENGALIYNPQTREEKRLCEGAPAALVDEMRRRGVENISVGRTIIATWEPHETVALQCIRDLGLEWQVIFNKGAVMILPTGVNKATGLTQALLELELSPHNTVGVGDAENDLAFLSLCECGVAVANALASTQEQADFVTAGDHGDGVIELIDALIENDLVSAASKLNRRRIELGITEKDQALRLDPYRDTILLLGTSGSGKSTIATGLFERLAEHKYQFCIVDPEGDYEKVESAVVLGDHDGAPKDEEVIHLLRNPERNAVVNLLAIKTDDRPTHFKSLINRLGRMREETGRPHWLIIDEAHHLLPAEWDPASLTMPDSLQGMLFITVHPEHVSRVVLKAVNGVIAIGREVDQTLGLFAREVGVEAPQSRKGDLGKGEGLFWRVHKSGEAVWFRNISPKGEHRRHVRKYMEGDMPEDASFYFRGADGRLNLRAQNFMLFLQIGDGVDDETWTYHLRRHDYSGWVRQMKDEELAGEIERVENNEALTPAESREAIREAIARRYTLPA